MSLGCCFGCSGFFFFSGFGFVICVKKIKLLYKIKICMCELCDGLAIHPGSFTCDSRYKVRIQPPRQRGLDNKKDGWLTS